ncbi:hypothetical protein HK098_001867, partial [Nowakowskiella sp. JEL0407]
GKNVEEIYIATAAIPPIFKKLFEDGSFERSQKKSNAQNQVASWLLKNQSRYVSALLNNISHAHTKIQRTSFESLLDIIKSESIAISFPVKTYKSLIINILKSSQYQNLRQGFMDKLNQYDDLRYYFYREINKVLETVDSEDLPQWHERVLAMLCDIETFVTKDSGFSFFCTPQPDGNEDESMEEIPEVTEPKSKTSLLDAQRPNEHKRIFSICWLAFLKIPIKSDALYKTILENMHVKIIPHLSQPTKLIDFLTDSYNAGGVISILALNSLFTLINEHNLDYPEFYNRLYSLLDMNVTHSKYRARFFKMVNLFLTSTYLPVYLVAAFAKRLSRLCLSAPPAAIINIIPLVFNLLLRHPQCLVLIHRMDTSVEGDAFDFNEINPEKCGALQSSLWEIQGLTNHYLPRVSKLALAFSESLAVAPYKLDEYLDHSYATLFNDEEYGDEVALADSVKKEIFDGWDALF